MRWLNQLRLAECLDQVRQRIVHETAVDTRVARDERSDFRSRQRADHEFLKQVPRGKRHDVNSPGARREGDGLLFPGPGETNDIGIAGAPADRRTHGPECVAEAVTEGVVA